MDQLFKQNHSFPNVTQWITEYGFDHQDLETTQAFFNESAAYFDRMDSVGRYSYFGSFRAAVSNVGPNAAMLSDDGRLTDIGAWYLGAPATGVDPQSTAAVGPQVPVLTAVFGAVFIGLAVLL